MNVLMLQFSSVRASFKGIYSSNYFFLKEVRGNSLTHGAIDRAEDYGHDDKPRVPVVRVVHRGHAEEHEYDGLRAARQHLHRILDGRMGLVRYIGLDVVLHGDAAECYPALKAREAC